MCRKPKLNRFTKEASKLEIRWTNNISLEGNYFNKITVRQTLKKHLTLNQRSLHNKFIPCSNQTLNKKVSAPTPKHLIT